MRQTFLNLAALIAAALQVGCTSLPDGVTAVRGFELDRYLGTWYEIARLDHRFERGLSNVTATYSMRDDGGVDVLNRGYDTDAGEWEEASGKAYFIEGPDVGRLKVSFFGPFYGAYNIVELDRDDYGHALVVGPNRSYLWVLSRSPALNDNTLASLVGTAERLDFATDELIYVDHTAVDP